MPVEDDDERHARVSARLHLIERVESGDERLDRRERRVRVRQPAERVTDRGAHAAPVQVPRQHIHAGLGRAPCVQCSGNRGTLPCAAGNARRAGGRHVYAVRTAAASRTCQHAAVQPLSIDAKLLLEAEGLPQSDERRLGRGVQP